MTKHTTLLKILAATFSLTLLGCESQQRETRSGSLPQQADHVLSTAPIRYSDESTPEPLEKIRLDALLEGLLPDASPYSSARTNGESIINVAIFSERGAASLSAQLLAKLGFVKAKDEPDGSKLLQCTIRQQDKASFFAQLKESRELATRQAAEIRARLEHAAQPGVMLAANRNAGGAWFVASRLVYTGQPLDLALPGEGDALYFLPIRLAANHATPGLQAGARAYVRGGRLYIGNDGALRVRHGALDMELAAVPADAIRIAIDVHGRCNATLATGETRELGRIALVKLERPEGAGGIFPAPADGQTQVSQFPGEESVGPLKIGHLEFPATRVAQETGALAEQLRLLRLLNGLEIALASPTQVSFAGGEAAPRTTDPTVEARRLDLMADLPLASAHLKALGIAVENLQGRTSITIGPRAEDQQRAVAALSKVLQGLLKRMAVCQQNHANAFRTRDEQKRLNPYRRKTVKIGEEGEVLSAEDESEFRKELKPESEDAGPDGFVRYPNVNRSLEQADFARAAEEYRLVRLALERCAPNVIFPEPPALQTDAKTP